MADHELTPEESLRLLDELFGGEDGSVPKRRCRKYVLDYLNGKPAFRFAEWFDELMMELFGPDPDGDEIVPQKLAQIFPGSSFGPGVY